MDSSISVVESLELFSRYYTIHYLFLLAYIVSIHIPADMQSLHCPRLARNVATCFVTSKSLMRNKAVDTA